MSMQDPIADMLTRVRNAQSAGKQSVTLPSSKLKKAMAALLKEEGYVTGYSVQSENGKESLTIELKYFEGQPVLSDLKRVSRPGLRIYRSKDDIPRIKAGLGIVVLSTSKGLMTDRQARAQGVGGEVLCYVS
jgi:small subunit ribosomal protein S8